MEDAEVETVLLPKNSEIRDHVDAAAPADRRALVVLFAMLAFSGVGAALRALASTPFRPLATPVLREDTTETKESFVPDYHPNMGTHPDESFDAGEGNVHPPGWWHDGSYELRSEVFGGELDAGAHLPVGTCILQDDKFGVYSCVQLKPRLTRPLTPLCLHVGLSAPSARLNLKRPPFIEYLK